MSKPEEEHDWIVWHKQIQPHKHAVDCQPNRHAVDWICLNCGWHTYSACDPDPHFKIGKLSCFELQVEDILIE